MDHTAETSLERTLLPCHLTRVPPQRWLQGPLVGAGSFGTVHKCLCLDTGSLVAVKSSSEVLDSPQMVALEREIGLLKQLTSPHVIGFLGDSWTEENSMPTRNLVMECAAGGSISSLLKTYGRGVGLPEPVIRRYTRDLLQGIRDIHGMGVAHLDIKGGNSLLTETGVKICDFGAARVVAHADTGPVQMRGTLCWMAPEIIQGNWGSMEADIWSLGCTVIEMITCSPPWAKAGDQYDWRAVMARVGCTKDLPTFPSLLSEAGKDFLSRCLVRDKDKRWTAEQLLQHPFITDEGTKRPYYSPSPQGSSPCSALSPPRSFEPAFCSSSICPALGGMQEEGFLSIGQRAPESILECRENSGQAAEDGREPRFLLFSACSGLPSPLLFSPLKQVAAALGSPAAETMEGRMSWVCRQNARGGLLKPCSEDCDEGRENSDLDTSLTAIPIAIPCEGKEKLESLVEVLNCWQVTMEEEDLPHSVSCVRSAEELVLSL